MGNLGSQLRGGDSAFANDEGRNTADRVSRTAVAPANDPNRQPNQSPSIMKTISDSYGKFSPKPRVDDQ